MVHLRFFPIFSYFARTGKYKWKWTNKKHQNEFRPIEFAKATSLFSIEILNIRHILCVQPKTMTFVYRMLILLLLMYTSLAHVKNCASDDYISDWLTRVKLRFEWDLVRRTFFRLENLLRLKKRKWISKRFECTQIDKCREQRRKKCATNENSE